MVDQNLNHNREQLWYSKRYATLRDIMVGRMILEGLRFAFQSVAHAFFGIDVLLNVCRWRPASMDIHAQDIQRVCTGTHKVKFCEYTNGAPALWINGTGASLSES